MITKSNIAAGIAAETGLKKKDAEAAAAAFIKVLTDGLINGERVQLTGFGTFEVKERGEHKGVNPKTGEAITIAASKYVSFAAGKSLKDAVKSGRSEDPAEQPSCEENK